MAEKRRKHLPGYTGRTKIEMLSMELQEEINNKLLAGESPEKVSHWLKIERNKNVGVHSVRDYWNKTHGPLSALRSTYYKRFTAGMAAKINALNELYLAAQVQMKRLGTGLELEQGKKTMLATVDKGLDLLRRICLDIITVEMDLGLRKRVSAGEAARTITDEQLRGILGEIISLEKQDENEPAAAGSD